MPNQRGFFEGISVGYYDNIDQATLNIRHISVEQKTQTKDHISVSVVSQKNCRH
jgi:hypothetical protein